MNDSQTTDWDIIEGVISRAQQTSEGEYFDLATQALNAVERLRKAMQDVLNQHPDEEWNNPSIP